MANLKKAATGAASGAAVGSVAGPWGTLAGGVVGGLYGLLSGDDDNQGAVDAANAQKLALMREAQAKLDAYRPQLMGAEQGAMTRRLGAYGGAQDALATMYGKGAYQGLPDPAFVVNGRNAQVTYPEAAPGMSTGMPTPGVQQSSASPFAAPGKGNGPPLGNFPLADPAMLARRPK